MTTTMDRNAGTKLRVRTLILALVLAGALIMGSDVVYQTHNWIPLQIATLLNLVIFVDALQRERTAAAVATVDHDAHELVALHSLEESLRRRNRALQAISDSDQVMFDARDEAVLLQGICEVVAAAGYRMAWAGLLSEDGSIVPAGITGEHHGYLDCLHQPLQAGRHGSGTVGEALRSGTAVVANDFAADLRLSPWRQEALRRGFHAKLALPLRQDEVAVGVLNVYAAEPDAFDAEEVQLLSGLARRVSAALQSLRHQSARRTAEAALRVRQRAIEAAANAVVITSAAAPDYVIEYVNPAYERMTGHAASQVIGHSFPERLCIDPLQSEMAAIDAAMRRQREGNGVLRCRSGDGTWYWCDVYVAPVKDEAGQVRHFVLAQYDITAMKLYEAELQHKAQHDTLTNLPNRALLQDRLEQAIAYAARSQLPVWVVFVDLDRFKVVNDTLGHHAGDLLLRQVAARLSAAVRQTDTVARIGGDEFVLILRESTNDGERLAASAVRRLVDAVAQPLTVEGHEFFPSCSVGVAAYPADGEDAKTLMMHADVAMYRAKEQGGNQVQFYAAAMPSPSVERLRLERDLRHALERKQLLLHYQPQVDLQSGAVVGMEALIRWRHPELGMVPPARFIGVAEETGLIDAIGAWVLRTACAQVRAWQEEGMGPLRVAVNLSARQFAQKELVKEIAAILEETGLDAHWLELELTESLVMRDVERTAGTLRELKALGVQVAIDDFGTGYSSLAYLKRFPIDVLKIDRSFVHDISTDPADAAIVASIISLSRNLQLNVIAEGVETPEQLAYLRAHRCHQMQGYYFSPPLPVEAFAALLGEGRTLAPADDCLAA